MLGFRCMMHPVGLNNPLHVIGTWHVPVRQAAMNNHVVKAEIYESVAGDARANPYGPAAPVRLDASPKQQDRRDGEDQRVKIVEFEKALARRMMALMQKPARPVHDPAMRGIGNDLHQENRA